jgi:type I restriction enzyme R subunit
MQENFELFNIITDIRVYCEVNKLAEAEARELIDDLLKSAGWSVQDYQKEDFGASLGIAVREFQLKTGAADYLLFINRKVVGVIEAKPVGYSLGGVDYQSEKYVAGLVDWIDPLCLDPDYPTPFLYESTGVVTNFRDLRDPDSRSRKVFAFHRPETLRDWLKDDSLKEMENLPQPEVIASEIVENLEFALDQFRGIVEDLKNK